jgi:outer membrane protein OmpA-like peptidoglycan-associated protein
MSTFLVQRLRVASVATALLFTAFQPIAFAQQPPVVETRPATVSVSGDTGLRFLPTAEILPAGAISVSLFRANADFGQGYTDVSNFPVALAFGLANRAEVFGSWTAVTRIDRDTRPLFGAADAGAGAGINNEYPMVRQQWSGNTRGDLRVGVKVNLLSQADNAPLALALRGTIKAPIGDEDTGASTGKMDYTADLIASTEAGPTELTASAGLIMRGDPDGFDLTNGIRWGLGAAFFSRTQFRLTAELHGERYTRDTITAPAAFLADDLSVAPITTTLKHPIYAAIGLTWQAPTGFFIGGGLNWSGAVDKRLNESSGVRDRLGIQVRIGYHPGVRKYVAPAPAPVVSAPVQAQAPVPTPTPAVEPTPEPAPVVRPVEPVQAPQPEPVKAYVFEDVHFDFDRNVLRPDALLILDDAITALQAEPELRLRIEGHTCNIGTTEYNLALAERRAQAVREYLTARGIDPTRLSIVSYGEERPIHDNEREETRRLNRRAALVVSVVR